VATLDNPGGAEVLALVRKAVAAEGKATDVVASAAMKSDGSNIGEMGRTLAAAKPQAVVIFVSGPPVAQLMRTMSEGSAGVAFYGMSIVAGDLVARLLGSQLRSLATTQVVPYPWSQSDVTAQTFRAQCKAANVTPSYASYEGYVNAMVAIEGLRRAGRDLRRSGLHAAMRSMKQRVAGIDLDYTSGSATGSRFVDLVHVGVNGQYSR
jgi:ABC-type branched-subunit amino acid transport system substrate-binding protein